MVDQPRSLGDPSVLAERLTRLQQPHVAPLNAWVQQLRVQLGPEAIVPFFDPDDGGTNARILWLLEAPGPKATRERGGSGLISCNNNDRTAENTWRTRAKAGVERQSVVHWNVVPYYLGTENRIVAAKPLDVTIGAPLLGQLLELLPLVCSVILGGKQAAEAWRLLSPSREGLRVFSCPHPSPQNLNTRPGARAEIVQAWRDAAQHIRG